jgi:hypothetical protein
MSDYRVSTVSSEEAQEVLARFRAGGSENKKAARTAILAGGIELKGSFELIARDAETGQVAWSHASENLITDFGRRFWPDRHFDGFAIGFSASTETPVTGRHTLCGDSTQLFFSANLVVSNNTVTHTKTVSATFATPANNRTLGTIFIQPSTTTITAGVSRKILAYALLTPPKTQTTVQTLEVVYKISMAPIY